MTKFMKTLIALFLLALLLALAACRGRGATYETTMHENGVTAVDTAATSDEGNSETGDMVGSLLGSFFSNNNTTENFVLKIDSYEKMTELYDYLKTADYYTLRYSGTAYDDCTSGKYDKNFFDGGGRLAAVAISCASGSYTYFTCTETNGNGVAIYLYRRNPYITIRTADIGRFVYLVPVADKYDEDDINVVRNESERATLDAFREKSTDTTFVSISSGKYKRYDGKTYFTEAFSAFSWLYMYDDNAGTWLSADGRLNYQEVLKENRDMIPAIKASEGMELCFAPGYTVASVDYTVLSVNLETEQKIGSLSELPGLPHGAYYLVCKVRTESRTIVGDTEKSECFCIFLLDV